jgi:hypothetical protein
MSSSSSQTLSSPLQRSTELVDLTSCSTMKTDSSFAPLHRTVELENLYDQINNEKQAISVTATKSTTKKILTKCMTVIGDGSDKQI